MRSIKGGVKRKKEMERRKMERRRQRPKREDRE
jgi:hypothetical protein